MNPDQASLEGNFDSIFNHTLKYAKEFKESNNLVFKIGDNVSIKNENKTDKMDDEFKLLGTIIE
ncbi:hypothetical protein M153_15753000125 [Pseudoloma neurophilia]|uniref:Transposable element n=1 Tax=Pseudoloma neurophilia TaxID=146866 RepID=A0A0R0M0V1_9MICR|nr:hypothetical protein M153_15753000125 [Pseudoloma neurophilia]